MSIKGVSQVVQPWIWLNEANTELAELKMKGVVVDETRKVLNSKTSEESLEKITLPELVGALEYNEWAKVLAHIRLSTVDVPEFLENPPKILNYCQYEGAPVSD